MHLFLCFLLFGCGGGGDGPTPTDVVSPPLQVPHSYNYLTFAPFLAKNMQGEFGGNEWISTLKPDGSVWVSFGTTGQPNMSAIEEHAVRTNPADGRRWTWVNAYIQQVFDVDGKPGNIQYQGQILRYRYIITTDRAEILEAGVWKDATPPAGTVGQPYAIVGFNGPFTVRVWGKIHGDPLACTVTGAPPKDCEGYKLFFWQHTIEIPAYEPNKCWKGDAKTTRLAIRQTEAWWEPGGWTIGTGTLGSDGIPNGQGIQYGRTGTMAEEVGAAWTVKDLKTGWEGCLITGSGATP